LLRRISTADVLADVDWVLRAEWRRGKSVAKGLEELDSLPALWGEAKPKPKKRSQKAMLQASSFIVMPGTLIQYSTVQCSLN
jgi:hypothetical protein